MSSPMPLGARVIALTALLWNLFGLLVFVLRVAATPEQQALDAALPAWINGVFGLAVITGSAGSIALLLARRWAPPMLLVSLLAALVQTLASYALAPVWAASGVGGVVMSAALLLMLFAIWAFARTAARRGWLR